VLAGRRYRITTTLLLLLLLHLSLDASYVRSHRLYLDDRCAVDHNEGQRNDRPNSDQHHPATATRLRFHRLAGNHDQLTRLFATE